MNAGLHALRLRGHAHLNLVDLSAESRMQEAAASGCRHLLLARWIRLPRRHMGP
jgi:hypothetical protein